MDSASFNNYISHQGHMKDNNIYSENIHLSNNALPSLPPILPSKNYSCDT